jgi:hypothetical protein
MEWSELLPGGGEYDDPEGSPRRGYAQGANDAIEAMVRAKRLGHLTRMQGWVIGPLFDWRRKDSLDNRDVKPSPPPTDRGFE